MRNLQFGWRSLLLIGWIATISIVSSADVVAQAKSNVEPPAKDDGVAVIRGRIAYDKALVESWDGNRLVVPYQEITAKIRQRVVPPAPPYPEGIEKWKRDDIFKWEKEFVESAAGKKFLEDRKKLIDDAHAFDVKFEEDGKFVIYDVPYGTYGIQGRVDKKINEKKYAFEVFGEIPVIKGMDDIPLKPMRVEVTPLIVPGEVAPPVAISTHDDGPINLKHNSFKDKFVFLNFWITQSPTAASEQKLVQEMYSQLKSKYDLKLISICVDQERKTALDYIVKNSLKEGSHGFTDGVDHRTIFDYGVRSFPSFWLIGKDGKIMMTQFEVAQAMRTKPDMVTIVDDRIRGKDVPTPATSEK
ncbi:MAG: thioredoxin-like domain-containing protein [Mariniblastus sp.]|nr:thioredoxin-like domain-containing protein [Mariniblastus sp.]